MKILDLVQGSPEWHAARAGAGYRGSSAAAAMMGASKKVLRSELVRMRATGDEREFTDWQREHLLDRGHEVEALARPIIEAELGEDLYPATGLDDTGYLIASFDGITMDEKTGWEHKLWNEELAAAVRAKDLPATHYWQLEHQLLVNEALERIIFTVSDGTPAKCVSMEYRRVDGRAKALMAGWRQFDEDVANYQHVEVLPKVTPEPVMALPALAVTVAGEITIRNNLGAFGDALAAFIERLPRDPKTDQDFANAEQGVKVLQDAQDKLEAAEANALAQTASVDEMRRTVAMLIKTTRETRLTLHKLVEAKKASIRADILREGVDALTTHILMLNTQLGGAYMPHVQQRFAEAMKGKKTIATLRDAVQTELARAKIETNEIAGRITVNLNYLRAVAAGREALFADLPAIALKPAEDFKLLVQVRLEADEKRKEEERARIRAEEQARAIAATAPPEKPCPVAPAPTVVVTAPVVSIVPGKPAIRPTDDQIVSAIAAYFKVAESDAVTWLLTFDHEGLRHRIPKSIRA